MQRIRAVLKPRIEKAVYTVIDPGAYETGTQIFSAKSLTFKSEGVSHINSFPIPTGFRSLLGDKRATGFARQIKMCENRT